METGDFIWYLLMAIILFVPFAWIYFILYTLNWDQRKNLFSDSWIVFITLLISSFAVIFVFLLADVSFRRYFYLADPVTFFLLTVLANIFSIVTVLTSRDQFFDNFLQFFRVAGFDEIFFRAGVFGFGDVAFAR